MHFQLTSPVHTSMTPNTIASANPSKLNTSIRKPRLHFPREGFASHNILLFLVALRILNALSINTFFQPDEYFQSLEPAWQMAFGEDSGAWITWVSYHRL